MTRLTSGPFAGLLQNGYGVIYADPAWTYETYSDKGKDRSPERHYSCMTLDEIKALPVRDLAAKDCALFLWIIDTHLPMALDVISSWGFTYKTKAFTWAKTNQDASIRNALDERAFFMGSGHWTRANPEDCLLATRGHPSRLHADVRRLIVSPRREHSRKPDEARGMIERLVAGPYVELFGRTSAPGWDTWGNETGKFNALSVAERLAVETLI